MAINRRTAKRILARILEMKKEGYSQVYISEQVGCGQSYISRIVSEYHQRGEAAVVERLLNKYNSANGKNGHKPKIRDDFNHFDLWNMALGIKRASNA